MFPLDDMLRAAAPCSACLRTLELSTDDPLPEDTDPPPAGALFAAPELGLPLFPELRRIVAPLVDDIHAVNLPGFGRELRAVAPRLIGAQLHVEEPEEEGQPCTGDLCYAVTAVARLDDAALPNAGLLCVDEPPPRQEPGFRDSDPDGVPGPAGVLAQAARAVKRARVDVAAGEGLAAGPALWRVPLRGEAAGDWGYARVGWRRRTEPVAGPRADADEPLADADDEGASFDGTSSDDEIPLG